MTQSATIFHNPRCSKSRKTLALLEERASKPVSSSTSPRLSPGNKSPTSSPSWGWRPMGCCAPKRTPTSNAACPRTAPTKKSWMPSAPTPSSWSAPSSSLRSGPPLGAHRRISWRFSKAIERGSLIPGQTRKPSPSCAPEITRDALCACARS